MHEARIKIRPTIGVRTAAQVPERFDPVGVVEVGVQAEDLTEARLDIAVKGLWKTGALAEPVAACERGEGRGGGGGTCCDRGVGVSGVEAAGGVGRGVAGDVVGWEGFGVVHLADDPALDQGNVLACWDLDGDFFVIEPGISVASELVQHEVFASAFGKLTGLQT